MLSSDLAAAAAAAASFQTLARVFDFSKYKTLADVGGSAGVLSCAVAQAHPHMRCTTLDLPAVHAAAEQYVAQQGLQDRVQVCSREARMERTCCWQSFLSPGCRAMCIGHIPDFEVVHNPATCKTPHQVRLCFTPRQHTWW